MIFISAALQRGGNFLTRVTESKMKRNRFLRRGVLLLLCVGVLICPPAWAGNPLKLLFRGAAKETFTRQIPVAKLERILSARVRVTSQQIPPLLRWQKRYVDDTDLPVKKVLKAQTLYSRKSPYAELPFWDQLSHEAKENYFLAANNRASRQVIQQRLQSAKTVQQNQESLWRTQKGFAPAPLENILLEEIPSQAQYILLGEEHDQAVILDFVSRFLTSYQRKYPARKICLLTEFLPVGQPSKYTLDSMREESPAYAKVFTRAQKSGITVYGLEPQVVFSSRDVVLLDEKYNPGKKKWELWVMPESMRARNRFWMQQIKAMRAQYPDAVFVIYAGADHVAYNASFSLAKEFPSEQTFIAHLFAEDSQNDVYNDWLDVIGGDEYPFRKQKVLSWKSPFLRRVAGFDIRFLISKKDLAPQ